MKNTFCLLTPPGRSAVATIMLRGKDLNSYVATRFVGNSSRPIQLKRLRPTFGYWQNESSQEGLVACMTDDHTVEIHSHGGTLAPQLISDTLLMDGFEELSPAQMVAESCSKWMAGIRQALIHAPTKKTALRLLKLYQDTPKQLAGLEQLILDQPDKAITEIEVALSFQSFGAHLSQPWKVVICGQPNVGKSSLINAISGFERTIVHDTPGTTRDVVSQVTAINGWPVLLTDTAGVRATDDEIEHQGVQKALQEANSADLRIGLFDASKTWDEDDAQVLQQLKPELIVHNKQDKQQVDSNRPEGLSISATERIGLENLMDAMTTTLIPEVPQSDQWFPIDGQQSEILRQVITLIQKSQLAGATAIIRDASRFTASGEL